MASDVDAISKNILSEANSIAISADKAYRIHSHTSKHFSDANLALGTTNVILAAIAASTQLKNLSVNPLLIGMMCLVVAVITAIIAFWKIDAKARDHYHAGIGYRAIKDDAMHFMNIEAKLGGSIDEKVKKLEGLSRRMQEQNLNSPLIPWVSRMLIGSA